MCTKKNVAERRKDPQFEMIAKLKTYKKNLGWDRCVYSWLINKSFRVWNYCGKKQLFLFCFLLYKI